MLFPARISGTGEEVHAVVNEPTGRWQTRRRFMLQLRENVEFLDVRPPTRIAGTREGLQVVVFAPRAAWIQTLRASGLDGIVVCQLIETDQDRLIYRLHRRL